jgi:ribosomal protein S1
MNEHQVNEQPQPNEPQAENVLQTEPHIESVEPQTEQAPAEQAQAEQAQPELAQAELAQAEPVQPEQAQAEQTEAEQPQAVAEQPQADIAQREAHQAAAKAAAEERRKAAQANWQRLVDAKTSGETVEGLVKTPVKGGLLVDISGYRGFLPASQTGVAKGTPLETLVKTTVPLKVLDVDEARKRVVVSHRRAVQEQRRGERQELIRSLKVGEERESTVVRLTDFGAFVDLGSGVDALVPVSELAFERVEKPADVVHVGEKMKVRILRVEQNGKKIAASRKGALSDPWREHAEVLKQGRTVEGKVIGKDRRLDVEIAPGVTGSISDREVNPEDYEIGETSEVTVRSIDFRNRRLRLGNPHTAAAARQSSSAFAPLGAELGLK